MTTRPRDLTQPLVYLGTPDEAVPPLRALVEAGARIVLVITRADARRGRRSAATPSPVKHAALALGLPVEHSLDAIPSSGARHGAVVAFGRIIPADLLSEVPMVNLHFSKLPRWRGAAPVERAILAGDTETAVAVMEMEAGLDTGPIHAESIVSIGPTETAADLRSRLVRIGSGLLVDTLRQGLSSRPRPQAGTPTYAAKITAADRRLDFRDPVDLTLRRVRLGRAWTGFRGNRLIVWEARSIDGEPFGPPGALAAGTPNPRVAGSDGVLELLRIQPADRPPMSAADWWHGVRPDGERLQPPDG